MEQGDIDSLYQVLELDQEIKQALDDLQGRGELATSQVLRNVQELHTAGEDAKAAKHARVLEEIAWERMHTGYWKDVWIGWRNLFAVAILFKVFITITADCSEEASESRQHVDLYKSCLKEVDRAILMSGPRMSGLHFLVEFLCGQMAKSRGEPQESSSKKVRVNNEHPMIAPSVTLHSLVGELKESTRYAYEGGSVPCEDCPSIVSFQRDYFTPEKPVLLKGLLNNWRAMNLWGEASYWTSNPYVADRTVPVEIGEHYVSEQWTQKLMTIGEFVEKHVMCEVESAKEVAYLAQYQIFDHIQQLSKDLLIPDYCALQRDSDPTDTETGDSIRRNCWFGPKGTRSPFHWDKDDNLLCQFVGYKYIRLIDRKFQEEMYPHKGSIMHNTSQVIDIFDEDVLREKFPKFAKLPYQDVILGPGDVLYIPPKWWHYVQSLTVSFSVSFWWT